MVYDSQNNQVFIVLCDGSVLQSDCTSNPSAPVRRLVPSIRHEQDVMTMAAVWVYSLNPLLVILAGLRSGQIILIQRNLSVRMPKKQAHSGKK